MLDDYETNRRRLPVGFLLTDKNRVNKIFSKNFNKKRNVRFKESKIGAVFFEHIAYNEIIK
jgi:hypothetical protein